MEGWNSFFAERRSVGITIDENEMNRRDLIMHEKSSEELGKDDYPYHRNFF